MLLALAGVLAAGILTAAFVLPVFRIYGNTMCPNLNRGDIVAAVKGQEWEQGDVIAFRFHNKILVKRLIAGPGCEVNIASDGSVYVDGSLLPEFYLAEKSMGTCTAEFPCTVPEESYFVLGDTRSVSADSRSAQIGCVPKEQVIGKVAFRLWGSGGIGRVQ